MAERRRPEGHPHDDEQGSGRERVSRAAYELFSREGIRAVGVDAVTARAGTAKMTLYRNFPSKDDLVLDFLRTAAVPVGEDDDLHLRKVGDGVERCAAK